MEESPAVAKLAMRRQILSFFLAVLCGCSQSTTKVDNQSQSGDVGEFILFTLRRLDGHIKNTNSLAPFYAKWTTTRVTGAPYLGDREETSIILDPLRFGELTNFLFQALGQPWRLATPTESGVLHGFYSIGDVGVAIQFYSNANEAGLIFVGKPLHAEQFIGGAKGR